MLQILEPHEFQVFHWRRRICKARDHRYYSAGPSKADGWKAKILSGKGLNPVNPHEHTDHRLYRPPPKNHFSNSRDNWKYFANVSSRKAPMIITSFASGPPHNLPDWRHQGLTIPGIRREELLGGFDFQENSFKQFTRRRTQTEVSSSARRQALRLERIRQLFCNQILFSRHHLCADSRTSHHRDPAQ